MRRRPCFLRATRGLVAGPAHSRRHNRPMILFFACLLTATGTVSAKKPKPVPPHPSEVTVIGEALFYDNESFVIQGQQQVLDWAVDSIRVKNGVYLRSGVLVHVVLTHQGLVPSGVVPPGRSPRTGDILAGAIKNPTIKRVRESTGADLVAIWANWIWTSGAMPVPPFQPSQGFIAVSTPRSVLSLTDVHETSHFLGGGHDEAHHANGGGAVPSANGFIAPDGTCDVLSLECERVPVLSGPNSLYKGVVYGDANRNNAGQANVARSLVAKYVAREPQSLEKHCVQDVESACLSGRFLVRVQGASLTEPEADFAALQASDGKAATFRVMNAAVSISTSLRRQEGRMVADLTVAGGRAGRPYRVIVTDTTTGRVRAWQTPQGKLLNLALPAAF